MAMRSALRWMAGSSFLGLLSLSAAGACGAGEEHCEVERICERQRDEKAVCELLDDKGMRHGSCCGQCVLLPEITRYWRPVLVWTGPKTLAPSSCGEITWVVPGTGEVIRPYDGEPRYLGQKGPSRSVLCPTCACSEPSCALPSTLYTRSDPGCVAGWLDETWTWTALPPDWDGACMPSGAVAGDPIGAVAVGPTRVSCEPVVGEPPTPGDVAGDEVAIQCAGGVWQDECELPEQVCLNLQLPEHMPEPWRLCVVVEGGDSACEPPAAADDPWPKFSEKISGFHRGIVDARQCRPCTCKPPEPSGCEAEVVIYEDAACSDTLTDFPLNDAGGRCTNTEPESAVGSLNARWVVNEPGPCTPEGGALVPDEPITICCLPRGDG